MRKTKPPFADVVYGVVRRVPRGKVVTYGQVALLAGRPRAARAVGTALGDLERPLLDIVPWQRVISASGRASHRDGFWGEIQREMLEAEGVRFDAQGRVDLARSQWKGARARARGAATKKTSAKKLTRWGGRRSSKSEHPG